MAMKGVALNCLMANKKPFVNVRDAVILETYLHFLAFSPLYRAHLIFFPFVGFFKIRTVLGVLQWYRQWFLCEKDKGKITFPWKCREKRFLLSLLKKDYRVFYTQWPAVDPCRYSALR